MMVVLTHSVREIVGEVTVLEVLGEERGILI